MNAVRNQVPEAATFGPPTPTAARIPTAELTAMHAAKANRKGQKVSETDRALYNHMAWPGFSCFSVFSQLSFALNFDNHLYSYTSLEL
jgi:hypothetical protein